MPRPREQSIGERLVGKFTAELTLWAQYQHFLKKTIQSPGRDPLHTLQGPVCQGSGSVANPAWNQEQQAWKHKANFTGLQEGGPKPHSMYQTPLAPFEQQYQRIIGGRATESLHHEL